MRQWARHSVYYHIVIDRFATGGRKFTCASSGDYSQQLCEWMGGTFTGITESLDYLQDLGIGVILLTPFFEGKKYHGYWTTDFSRVDPHLGTEHDLRQLIIAAHQRNLRIIIDIPMTHCHASAPIAQQAFVADKTYLYRWFHHDTQGNALGFFGDTELPELNLESPEVMQYFMGIITHWMRFGFDGIRFDHAKRPSASFWQKLSRFVQNNFPQAFLLAENWNESGAIGSLSPYLHAELNIPLNALLRDLVRLADEPTLQRLIQHTQQQQHLLQQGYLLPSFLDNHDMERISLLAKTNQPLLSLAFLLQFTLPYPPIIYFGSERAQSQSDNLSLGCYERDRFFREPMNWQQGDAMAAWIKQLIAFRSRYIDWFTSEPQFLQSTDKLTLAYCYHKNAVTITILINFGSTSSQWQLPSSPDAIWFTPAMTPVQHVPSTNLLTVAPVNAAIITAERITPGVNQQAVTRAPTAAYAG